MTNNVDDIASYLQYQALVYGPGYTDSTQPGSAASILANTFSYNPAAGQSPIDAANAGTTWNLGLLDFLATSGVPTLNYTYDEITPDSDGTYAVYRNNTLSQWQATDLTNVYMSITDIYQFYQNNPYNSNSSAWDAYSTDSNGQANGFPWWTQNTARFQFFNYFNKILSIAQQRSNDTLVAPPHTFAEFVDLLKQVNIYTASGLPNFPNSGFDPSLPPELTAQLSPLLTLTPQPATPATTDQAFQGLLVNFLAKYPLPSSGEVDPETFAANWQDFLSQPISGPPPDSADVQINILGQTSSGLTSVMNYKTAPIPGYDGTSSVSFTGAASFPSDFAAQLEAEYDAALQTATDWQGLTLPVDTHANFLKSFDFFVKQVVGGGILDSGEDFFKLWSAFVGPSTLIQDSPGSTNSVLTTYQNIFNIFYPDQAGQFITRLDTFVQKMLNSPSGIFNPSLDIDQWFNQLKIGFDALPTTLDVAGYSNTSMINSVYGSIIDMINELQKLTIAQANRLKFYSQYQESYTTEMQSIPTYSPNDGSAIQGSSTTDSTNRQNANAASNRWIQNLRNYRSNIGNTASNTQSLISQSNSAVNAQTDIATRLLQLITQLLQSIFHQKG